GFVGPATKLVNLRHPVAVGLRRLAMSAVSHLGLTALAARRASELDVNYRHSPVVGEHRQGTGERFKSPIRHGPHPRPFDWWDFGTGPPRGERAADARGLTDGSPEPRRLYQDWVGDHRHQLLAFTGGRPTAERVGQLAELAAKVEAGSGGLIRARLVRPADVC